MKYRLIQCEQGSDEWRQARCGLVTASRFGSARARMKVTRGQRRVGDFTAEAESYAQLLAIERIFGAPLEDTPVTWQMQRGTDIEPAARSAYEERTGSIIQEKGLAITLDERFGYSTDGAAFGQSGGIEIKTPAAADKVAGVWLDPAPVIAEYMDQIDGGMWITGWDWIDLCVYTPWLGSVGKDLFIQRIYRSPDRLAALEKDLLLFAALVDAYEQRLRAGASGEPSMSGPSETVFSAPEF